MKDAAPLKFRKNRTTGVVTVRIRTPRGIQWVNTGTLSFEEARRLCTDTMLQQLQAAHNAGIFTADIISRLTTGRRFTCADILEAWKADQTPDMIAPETVNNYHSLLLRCLKFCECESKPISAVSRLTLSAWVNERGTKHGARKLRLAAIRSFYAFACSSGYCIGNKAEYVGVDLRSLLFIEREPTETLPFSPEEYAILMASDRVSPFWKSAIALSYWAGFRLRDVCCLQWASIAKPGVLVIYQHKTGERLELPIDDPLIGGGVLRGVIERLNAGPKFNADFCFPEMQKRIEDVNRRAGVSVAFKRVLERHGIDDKRFHGFRHACGMRLKEANRSLEEIAATLGHASTETTKVYLAHD